MSEVRKETGYFESFDGTPIYYEVRGEGRPLIMAYGIGCLMNHWRYQVKSFADHYKVILFDYRGHHLSGRSSEGNYTLHALARDLKGLTKHLGIRKASFWSHSFGSQVLLETYRLQPSLFANLVMINAFATNPLKNMFGNDLALQAFRTIKQAYDHMPGLVGTLWKRAVNNPLAPYLTAVAGGFNLNLTNTHDIEVYARGVSAMDLDAFTTLFENMVNYDGRNIVRDVEVPTLLIGGEDDSVTPPHLQRELHQSISGSELLLVPYCSHCTQLDMPDFVNLRIEKFLRQQKFR